MKKVVTVMLSLLLGGSVVLSFAGCHVGVAEGIDKNDPYTWFEANKEVLPTREQCREITVGMRLNEVIEKLGKPQRDVGSGVSLFQFDVADGSAFIVRFETDVASDPSLPTYDRLIVDLLMFDAAVPDLYFPQQTVLSNLYPWMEELEEGDIVKVRYEQAFIGVAPYDNFRNISYSADQTDIANAYRLFSAPLHAISQSEGQIDGGGYVRYDFTTAEETYSVTFSNNTVLIGERYYRFDGELFEFADPEVNCRAFITYTDDDPYEVYTYAEESEKIGDYQGLGEFEFRVYDGLLENTPCYVLKSAGGVDLLILSADKFLIKGETVIYQITGEKDFSFLF